MKKPENQLVLIFILSSVKNYHNAKQLLILKERNHKTISNGGEIMNKKVSCQMYKSIITFSLIK